MDKLIVSTSPHIRTNISTRKIMLDVLIALAPATVAGVVLFGLRALLVILITVGSAVLSEFLFNIITKREQTIKDLSAVVTGLILALSLPSKAELWQCAVGAVFAIIVVKCLFGGLGANFANPAATARVFLLISFASIGGGAATNFAEITASATPLEAIKQGQGVENLPSLLDMLLGNRAGAIGETCIIALVLGGIYLIARRVIHWHVPVAYVLSVFLLTLAIKQDVTIALYEVLGGAVVLAAFFMITDYVTTPINELGKVVFAVGCGIITVLIRMFGSYPEGVSFAILLMNIVSPYIERLCTRKPLGKGGKA